MTNGISPELRAEMTAELERSGAEDGIKPGDLLFIRELSNRDFSTLHHLVFGDLESYGERMEKLHGRTVR